MRLGRADDIMAEKARERHLFVFRLSTLAAVVSEASIGGPRSCGVGSSLDITTRVRMYDTMLSGCNMLSTTSHTLELLPCTSVDGRDMRSSQCASEGLQNGIICRRWSMP